MSKRPDIIRVNDTVRVIIPKIVTRVGYPKTVKDYLEEARAKYGLQLLKDMGNDRVIDKVLREIAYGLAKADGFGGRDRTLHLQDAPETLGEEFRVQGVRMVQTGRYYPPSGGYDSWNGDYDWEPGGLADMKARRLIQGWSWNRLTNRTVEFPAEHLEKIG